MSSRDIVWCLVWLSCEFGILDGLTARVRGQATGLSPLASQVVAGYRLEVWTVEKADPKRQFFITALESFKDSHDDFFGDHLPQSADPRASELSIPPSSRGNVSGIRSPGLPNMGKKPVISHVLGIRVVSANTQQPVAGLTEFRQGYALVDESGNSESLEEDSSNLVRYAWERPPLAPLPVGISDANAKSIKSLSGKLILAPIVRNTFVLQGPELKPGTTKDSGYTSIRVASLKQSSDGLEGLVHIYTPKLGLKMVDPKPGEDLREMMARQQALIRGAELLVEARLEDSAGGLHAPPNIGKSSVSIDQNFNRTLYSRLSKNAKARSGKSIANASDDSEMFFQMKGKFDFQGSAAHFKFAQLPSGVTPKQLVMTIGIQRGTPQIIPFTLENISLAVSRSDKELEMVFASTDPQPVEPSTATGAATQRLDSPLLAMNGNSKSAPTPKPETPKQTASHKSTPSQSSKQTAPRVAATTPDDPAGLYAPIEMSPWRFWQDASGKFSIEAVLVSSTQSTVTLKKRDGKVLNVPLSKLSKSDQEFLKRTKESK